MTPCSIPLAQIIGGPISFPLLAIVLAGTALALPDSNWSRRARAGIAALWLGLASLTAVFDTTTTNELGRRIAQTPPPAHFLAGSAALITIGLALATVAAVHTLRTTSVTTPARWAAIVTSLVAVGAAAALVPLWRAVSPLEVGLAATGIVLVSVGLFRLSAGVHLRSWIVRADRWLGPGAAAPRQESWPRWQRVTLVVAIVVALIPMVTPLIAGTITAAVLLHVRARRQGEVGPLPLLVLTTLGLLPAGWLIVTVTGSLAARLQALSDAPFSPAAELWIAPWLLIAAWGLLGLWPLHQLVPRPCLAGLAGVALIGVGVIGTPLGLQAFQPWLLPVLLVSLAWSIALDRPEMTLAALSLAGALAVPESARWLLIVPFVVTSALAVIREAGRVAFNPALFRLLLVVAGCGLWFGLVAGLLTQVLYTVLCVAGVAVAANSGNEMARERS